MVCECNLDSVKFITSNICQMGFRGTVSLECTCLSLYFFIAITPKTHGPINPALRSQQERGVLVKLKESERINPRLERLAGSAAFWLGLGANRLNQEEKAKCPGRWVVMMGMLSLYICACWCVCRAGAGTSSGCYEDVGLCVCVLTGLE